MKTAYLECFSGVSGDMLLGAIIDLGLEVSVLEEALASLEIEEFHLVPEKVLRNHIAATHISIQIEITNSVPRNFEDISRIITNSNLPYPVKEKSLSIFEDLALVESRIHGCGIEEVHFHEVGAVDSIIDIIGSVLGLHIMGIGDLYVSKIPLGSGFVDCAHGRLPIPAPATLELLKNIPVYDSGIEQELVTPTGAALIKHLAKDFGTIPIMKIHRIGYGAGSKELQERPNILRLIVGEEICTESESSGFVVVLESNLDDSNPEWLGYLMEKLFEHGALDVAFMPLQMKKNRPGIKIEVVAPPSKKDHLMEIIFGESSSIGIRFHYCERKLLKRGEEEVSSPWGRMKIKKITMNDGSPVYVPEYEECKRIAQKNDVPLKQVYGWVTGLNNK